MEVDIDQLDIKKRSYSWQEGRARTITFVVTENCQFRCKYCYVVHKNSRNKMNFKIAKRTVDYLLTEKEIFNDESVIFDFVGGEPLLEIELIDKLCDYIKMQMYELDHPWFNSYRFSFSTNGILYTDPRVQKFIEKNKTHMSIGITLDGTKRKHDLQRVYADGRGSYEDVVKNVPLWLKQFPNSSTKVTVASDDLPYIKESVLHLWSLGIKEVNINVVFEDVWKDGDEKILEQQLKELADEIIEKDLYKEHFCSFFMENLGKPLDINDNQNWCGSGRKMLAIDCKGNFYPCNRFLPFTMANNRCRVIGNCYDGINLNKLRPFMALDRLSQSPEECIECDVARGCAWCVGLNYDMADTDTIYQRATYICKMHKARVKANRYYWQKLARVKGQTDKKNINKQYIETTNINSKLNKNKIKYLNDKAYMRIAEIVRIMKSNDDIKKAEKSNLNIENHFIINEVPDYNRKENIEKYYRYYLSNLKNLPYRMEWLNIDQLPDIDKLSWQVVGDAYLADTDNDKLALALDILENGTYWPLFVFKEKNTYRLRDGAHRIYSIKLLDQRGAWDKKLLVVTDEIIPEIENSEKIFYIPSPNVVTDHFLSRYIHIYKNAFKQGINHIDKGIIEYKEQYGYLAQMMICYLLRNAIFEYKKITGNIIKPAVVINDYDEWKKWRGY